MLIRQLEQTYHAAVETAPAGEDAPVLLHNSGFAQPTQGVVETFALSRQGGDRSHRHYSVVLLRFFGLMLSDAAYGPAADFGLYVPTGKQS